MKKSGNRNIPHHDYYRNKKKCDDVFKQFPNYQRGSFENWHHQFNIPSSTIRGWYKKWLENPEWRPYIGDAHGLHNRIFSNEEEASICDFVVSNFIEPGNLFTNMDFKRVAADAYLQIHIDDEIKEVQFSNKFVSDFKKRNHLSSRKAHYRRRPKVVTKEKISNWVKKVRTLIDSVPHDRILNADETSVRILQNNLLTWAEMGSDSVTILVDDDEKKMITAMATISLAGTKFPLF